ncbi:MAG: PIG-L family deacetylase [Candidatus Hermodarchaeota archaeon]|nr:PIG-L family deacetylase [Candidatus Hermodarchaeota archaeon]
MSNSGFKKTLVLSPHTDDGELGAGGTIAKLIESGSEICYFAFSAPKARLKEECRKSLKVLGVTHYEIFDVQVRLFPSQRQKILDILFEYNEKNQVDLVLTPSTNDLHQDHQTVTNEALRIFKESTILGYELPWNLIDFKENCFVPLKEQHVKKKINALWNYESQIQAKRPYFNEKYLKSLMLAHGLKIRKKYAEAFEAIKLVLNEF